MVCVLTKMDVLRDSDDVHVLDDIIGHRMAEHFLNQPVGVVCRHIPKGQQLLPSHEEAILKEMRTLNGERFKLLKGNFRFLGHNHLMEQLTRVCMQFIFRHHLTMCRCRERSWRKVFHNCSQMSKHLGRTNRKNLTI